MERCSKVNNRGNIWETILTRREKKQQGGKAAKREKKEKGGHVRETGRGE